MGPKLVSARTQDGDAIVHAEALVLEPALLEAHEKDALVMHDAGDLLRAGGVIGIAHFV